MFTQAYLDTAAHILGIYIGEEPFSSFLKKFFASNKKFGSRDRKQISHLCFCFFRLGKSLPGIPVRERITAGLFLCSNEKNLLLQKLKPGWNELAERSLSEKEQVVGAEYSFALTDIFSFQEHVSGQIDFTAFSSALLVQPNTFLRVRPGREKVVDEKLSKANISFEKITEHCLAIAPATKLEEALLLNKDAVIQDFSSQRVIEPLLAYKNVDEISSVWDCCAASGGKSILVKDYYPAIRLTVSDVRNSILINLRKRFEQAGINGYTSYVADVAASDFIPAEQFDLVICDVPCSGSGTWSRTPEQLYFFEESKIAYYANLQKKIISNAVKALKPGSVLLYITCSVFTKENEDAVNFIQEQLHLKLVSANYFKGYQQRADTLFAALFSL